MSVSEPFIRRPIATSLLGIALLIGGALGYWALPVSALPQVDFPTVQVTTQLPGASPDVVASLITAPLERQLGQIPSLSSMQSTSSFGVSQISLQFDLNRDIDGATQDVQAAINAAAGILPRNLPYPPIYAKVNPADAPVLTLALTSETISLRAMSDIADTILAQRLSQISGVGRVSVLGGLKPAVRVQADLARLAAYGISMEDLRIAIAGANVSGPKGSLDGAQQAYTIAANDQIAAAEAYKPIIIAYRNGAPVTIGDVAIIVDGLENDRTGGWYQGTPAVIIDIQRQPGANVIEVVRQIRAEIPKVQRAIPGRRQPDHRQRPHRHHPRLRARRAVHADPQRGAGDAGGAVVPALAARHPDRRRGAAAVADHRASASCISAGFSLDNLSLMALTIGTGFVVDDAIVMIENIVRHMEDGESVMEASLKGASEIGFTVISLTVSLIAVFIPLLFMSGLVGRMFREFALTLTIAVVTSAIVSLTLTPMMCSRLLKHVGEECRSPRACRRQPRHRPHGRILSPHAAVGAAAPARDPAGDLCHHRRDAVPVCDRAKRLSAAAGHRLDHRGDRGRPRRFLCRNAEPAGEGGGRDQGRPRCGRRRLGDRRGLGQPDHQCRPPGDDAETARRAARRCLRRDRAPEAARRRHDPGHDDLFPAGAGRADLDPVEPLAIPVHADRHRRGAGERCGPTSSSPRCAAIRCSATSRRRRRMAACAPRSTSTASAPASSASASRPSTTP